MPADAKPPAGVVLAAGASTRMGENKLLLRLDGEPLVARAARRAAEAGLDPVLVVLGHDAADVVRALEGVRCRTVINPEHATGGQGSSFRSGIAAVPAEAPGAVVLLADMPHVTPAMIASLVERHFASGAALVVSEYGGVHAPPTLYGRALFPEILTGRGCGRDVVRHHRGDAEVVAFSADRLADLDEPGDVERLRASGAEILRCAPTS